MIKIYIDETPVIITKDESFFNRNVLALRLRYYNPEIIDDVMNHTKSGGGDVVILHDHPKEVLRAFIHRLKFIVAAGGIVVNGSNELLMIKRKGIWDLPKGKLEPGESTEEGALREVEEECGISGLTITAELPGTWHCYPFKGKTAIKHTHWYLMRVTGKPTPVPQTEEEIELCEWVDADLFFDRMNASYASLSDMVKSANPILVSAIESK